MPKHDKHGFLLLMSYFRLYCKDYCFLLVTYLVLSVIQLILNFFHNILLQNLKILVCIAFFDYDQEIMMNIKDFVVSLWIFKIFSLLIGSQFNHEGFLFLNLNAHNSLNSVDVNVSPMCLSNESQLRRQVFARIWIYHLNFHLNYLMFISQFIGTVFPFEVGIIIKDA